MSNMALQYALRYIEGWIEAHGDDSERISVQVLKTYCERTKLIEVVFDMAEADEYPLRDLIDMASDAGCKTPVLSMSGGNPAIVLGPYPVPVR